QKGCPWDLKQTPYSLAPYVLEEAYELFSAIHSGRRDAIVEELGDYLYQVIIQCQIAKEKGLFDVATMLEELNQKLIRRHPHVFANETWKSPEEVLRRWQEIKSEEKKKKGEGEKAHITSPRHAPQVESALKCPSALKQAHLLGQWSASVQFDWPNAASVWKKVEEEKQELEQVFEHFTASSDGYQELEHEIGDLLFSIVQLARHLGIDGEVALLKTNQRFVHRFEKMVELSKLTVDEFLKLPAEEKEKWYQKVKELEIAGNKRS
ncbi:MAG: nucleoside triphosphate pyrophosphohydrolase, partial [Bdellovibrionaceae bacterium]|nr:nucleoside triphosphate pyrophosphohydrolase [Pseudobdellovibrionaceae bacterium]